MTPELWHAKKIVDSTLHPGWFDALARQEHELNSQRYRTTGVSTTSHVMLRHFKPDRHGRHAHTWFTGSGLILRVPRLLTDLSQTTGTLLWQITNQSLNVAINNANANKSIPLSTSMMVQSYFLAVSASCSVALGLNAMVPRLKSLSPSAKTILTRLVPFTAVASAGALNVLLMRGEEIRHGIDVYPVLSEKERAQKEKDGIEAPTLGKSKKAATLAVGETALSRVLNSTPVMVLPPLVLVRLQQTQWLKKRARMVIPINIGGTIRTMFYYLKMLIHSQG